MTQKITPFMVLTTSMMLFSGCAEDNYYNNSYYGHKSNYDRKMEHEVRKDAIEASKMLSVQDIQKLESMRK